MLWPAEIVHTHTGDTEQKETVIFQRLVLKSILESKFSLHLHQRPTLVTSECLSKYNRGQNRASGEFK